MRLEAHIGQLLYKHDCVIVPNFGAFISNVTDVTFDEKTNTFYPPKKELSFNSSLIKNDGILLNKIINDGKISSEQAQTFLSEQVYFWQEHLKEGKVLILKEIGSLQLNGAGKIDFKPENAQNYFIPAYGLSSIKANYILDSPKVKTSSRYMSKILVVASIIPIVVGGFLYFKTPQPIEKFVKEQWSGLVIPMFNKSGIFEGGQPSLKYDIYNTPQTIADPSLDEYEIVDVLTTENEADTSNSSKKVEMTVVKETKINNRAKEVSVAIKEEPSVKKDIPKIEKKSKIEIENKKAPEKQKTVEEQKITNNKKYQVVAASLKRKEDADRMIEELKKQGYKKANVSYLKGRYYYVAYDSFDNKDEAQKYMNEVNKKNPGTWVRSEK